jgi:hypothetical protein
MIGAAETKHPDCSEVLALLYNALVGRLEGVDGLRVELIDVERAPARGVRSIASSSAGIPARRTVVAPTLMILPLIV